MRNNARLFTSVLIAGTLFLSSCGDDEETVWGDWIKSSDFDGVARSDAASFTIGDKGYVFGGYDGKKRLIDLWEFNTEGEYWTQKASALNLTDTATARNSATAFDLDGMGYVGTGYDGEDYLNDFWRYDPATNTWDRMPDFPGSARYGAVSFGVNHKGYLGTGYDGNYLKDIYRFDPASGTWETEPIVSFSGSKRKGATSFVIGTKAYIVCGENNGSYPADIFYYDAVAGQWSEAWKITDESNPNALRPISNSSDKAYDDDYNIARANGVALKIGDLIYLACGESGSLREDTWIYNPVKDLWTESTAFEGTTRTGTVGISTGERGFIATGRSSTYRFDDVWEFLPDAEYNEGY